MDVGSIYRLMISAVVPRPIAWVSTVDKQGRTNLAPFSYFNAVASRPPSLMFSVAVNADGTEKDTLHNIKETGQFVVNGACLPLLDELNETAAPFSRGVSEFKEVGLTEEPSLLVKPPRVKEAILALECELMQLLVIGDGGVGSATMVIGRILCLHAREDAINAQGALTPEALEPVARLGGQDYGLLGAVITKPRQRKPR